METMYRCLNIGQIKGWAATQHKEGSDRKCSNGSIIPPNGARLTFHSSQHQSSAIPQHGNNKFFQRLARKSITRYVSKCLVHKDFLLKVPQFFLAAGQTAAGQVHHWNCQKTVLDLLYEVFCHLVATLCLFSRMVVKKFRTRYSEGII